MVFDQLLVVHQRKQGKPAISAFDAFRANDGRFCIETCLRRLLISHAADSTLTSTSPTEPNAIEFLRGIDAYDLLLRIASGLESEVLRVSQRSSVNSSRAGRRFAPRMRNVHASSMR